MGDGSSQSESDCGFSLLAWVVVKVGPWALCPRGILGAPSEESSWHGEDGEEAGRAACTRPGLPLVPQLLAELPAPGRLSRLLSFRALRPSSWFLT